MTSRADSRATACIHAHRGRINPQTVSCPSSNVPPASTNASRRQPAARGFSTMYQDSARRVRRIDFKAPGSPTATLSCQRACVHRRTTAAVPHAQAQPAAAICPHAPASQYSLTRPRYRDHARIHGRLHRAARLGSSQPLAMAWPCRPRFAIAHYTRPRRPSTTISTSTSSAVHRARPTSCRPRRGRQPHSPGRAHSSLARQIESQQSQVAAGPTQSAIADSFGPGPSVNRTTPLRSAERMPQLVQAFR